MSALYVYALAGRSAAPFVAHGHRIEFVEFGDVHAAVERSGERPAVSEAALRIQHEIVIRISASVEDALPVRFGARLEEDELGQLVDMRRDVIQRALDLVRGRVQMTVRIRAEEATDRAAAPTPAAATGTAYLEARRAAAARPLTPMAMAVAAAVRHLAVSEKVDGPTDRASTTLYHLIDKHRVDEYNDALSSLQSSTLTVSGPWPAFAFAPDLWP